MREFPGSIGVGPSKLGQHVQLASVKLVTDDGQMGPRFFVADFQRINQFKLLRIGANQEQLPALIQRENSIFLRNQAAIFAVGCAGPSPFAIRQIEAGEALILKMQLHEAVDQHGGRHVRLRLARPQRRNSQSSLLGVDFVQPGVVLITAGEDRIVENEWS